MARGSGTSLLFRNLSKDARAEDIRYAAEKYGRVRDVYLPKDYYTKQPRGIGFVEFYNYEDAEDCQHGLDGKVIEGLEVKIVFAEQGRKRPDFYIKNEERGGRYSDRRGGGHGRDRYDDRRDDRYDDRRGSHGRDRYDDRHGGGNGRDRYDDRRGDRYDDRRGGGYGKDDRDSGRDRDRSPPPRRDDRGYGYSDDKRDGRGYGRDDDRRDVSPRVHDRDERRRGVSPDDRRDFSPDDRRDVSPRRRRDDREYDGDYRRTDDRMDDEPLRRVGDSSPPREDEPLRDPEDMPPRDNGRGERDD